MQEKRKPRRGDNYESIKKKTRRQTNKTKFRANSKTQSQSLRCAARSNTDKHRAVHAHAAKTASKARSQQLDALNPSRAAAQAREEGGAQPGRRHQCRRLEPRHHEPTRCPHEPRHQDPNQRRSLEPRHHGLNPPRHRASPAGADSKCPTGVSPSRQSLDSGGELPES